MALSARLLSEFAHGLVGHAARSASKVHDLCCNFCNRQAALSA
jgi:hypothetical protein